MEVSIKTLIKKLNGKKYREKYRTKTDTSERVENTKVIA